MELVRFDRRPFQELYDTFQWRIPPVYNIGVDVCDKWAEDPDRVALIDATGAQAARYTFAELARRSHRRAHALGRLGDRCREPVAILLFQRHETAPAHIATYKLGATAVTLATLFCDEALE